MDTAAELSVALVQTASSRVPAENRAHLASLDVPPAEAPDGPFVEALTAKAAKHGGTWVAGMLERSEDPARPYNTLVVVDPDGLHASYRKIHLYDSFGFKESDRLSPGPRTPLALEVAGVPVGLMTCYDLRFPELARALSRDGVQVMVVPSAWVAGPRKVHHWRTLVTARAIENVSYVAAVCQSAPRYTGHSLVVDPRGDVLAEAGDDDEVLLARASTDLLAEARAENPSLLNRRDDTPF